MRPTGAPSFPRDPTFDRVSLQGRVFFDIEALGQFEFQRRHIIWIIRIDVMRKTNECFHIGRRFYRTQFQSRRFIEHEASFLWRGANLKEVYPECAASEMTAPQLRLM